MTRVSHINYLTYINLCFAIFVSSENKMVLPLRVLSASVRLFVNSSLYYTICHLWHRTYVV